MDKNNLSVQASLDASQLKKDLDKFKGEIRLNAKTKNLKKQVESALKGMTIQPSLDTSQLKKDLGKFTGEVKLNADTTTLAKQVKSAMANASQNATANIHCNLSGMDSVIGQINNAASLNNDMKLNVSVDTSGLQQYTNQLKEIAQLSSNLQMPPLNTSKMQTDVPLTKADTSFASNAATDFKEASTEGNKFSSILSTVASSVSLLATTLNMPSAFKSFSKNLD